MSENNCKYERQKIYESLKNSIFLILLIYNSNLKKISITTVIATKAKHLQQIIPVTISNLRHLHFLSKWSFSRFMSTDNRQNVLSQKFSEREVINKLKKV